MGSSPSANAPPSVSGSTTASPSSSSAARQLSPGASGSASASTLASGQRRNRSWTQSVQSRCAHLPPAVQHQQTGPELCQRHPAQRALRSQLLTVHQPDAAVQRFAQLLRQPAAQFEPRGTGGHPEDAGIRLFCQHLPHDAALAGARRTHQRGPVALLQGGRRRTAGRFV